MKQFIALIVSTGLVYTLMSLIAGQWHPFQWRWSLRLISALWLIASWREILNSDNIK